jgi:hypothetical protein
MAVPEISCCPKCQGERLKKSNWRTHEEKRRHPGLRPVRCEDCKERFLVPDRRAAGPSVLVGLGIGVVLLVLAVTVFLVDSPPPAQQANTPAQVSNAFTPEAMKAAEAGDANAQYQVASALLADSELNLAYSSKAIGFLQQAAEKGHARAMLRLGLLYRSGVGALQNFGLAAKWIEKAARQGEPQGMLELGRLYREGVGLPRDLVQAYVWLNRAAAARDGEAIRERADVLRLLTPTELQKAQEASASGDFAVAVAAAATPAAEKSPEKGAAPAR